VRTRCLNTFYHESNEIYTVDDFKSFVGKIEWSGGTETGTRLNTILAEYFKEWNTNSGMMPLSIIYIGDGTIDDMEFMEKCIVNCAYVTSIRMAPKQITFQLYQVGNDEKATQDFINLDDNLKNKHNLSADIVDCIYGTGTTLIEKVKKGIIGSANCY
jgi:hypothetical protein